MPTIQAVKERPVLFSPEMVRGILDSRKTRTRRVIATKPLQGPEYYFTGQYKASLGHPASDGVTWAEFNNQKGGSPVYAKCPYGKPGDRLWVREAWAHNPDFPGVKASGFICYKADPGYENDGLKWKPSIHMPRWACRVILEVTDVRVERLSDICEPDALAEGVDYLVCPQCGCGDYITQGASLKTRCSSSGCGLDNLSAIEGFRELWDSLAKPECTWGKNPWVWVIEFRKVV